MMAIHMEKEVHPEDLSGWEGDLARSALRSPIVKALAMLFGVIFILTGFWAVFAGNLSLGLGLAMGGFFIIEYFRKKSAAK